VRRQEASHHACFGASRGGTESYKGAGYELAGAIAGLSPDDLDPEEWHAELEKLQNLTEVQVGDQVLAWFERHVPRCMKPVPRRRRDSFLRGVYAHVLEGENPVTVY
jgi:hypothetical protein